MPFIENPETPSALNFIHYKKDIILQKNGILPEPEQFSEIKNTFSPAVFYRDTEYGFSSLILSDSEDMKKLPGNFVAVPLRQYFASHAPEENISAARSRTIGKWLLSQKFCPECASRLTLSTTLNCKVCPECKKEFFPRLEPAVIVLIKKGDEILLARHKNRIQNVWACISGFVEAGETIEQAVHREVYEETGLKVRNLQYKGSQSWPFPDQLMFAFTAEYESGEIKVQEEELSEAAWFKADRLPETPAEGSVAFRLIHNLFD